MIRTTMSRALLAYAIALAGCANEVAFEDDAATGEATQPISQPVVEEAGVAKTDDGWMLIQCNASIDGGDYAAAKAGKGYALRDTWSYRTVGGASAKVSACWSLASLTPSETKGDYLWFDTRTPLPTRPLMDFSGPISGTSELVLGDCSQ